MACSLSHVNEEQKDEISVLESILGEDVLNFEEDKHNGHLIIKVDLPLGADKVTITHDDSTSEITHLPPLVLKFSFPLDYPSMSPPEYSIHCGWMSKEKVTLIERRLWEMWNENKGNVILFLWHQELKENTFEIAGLVKDNQINLPLDKETGAKLIFHDNFQRKLTFNSSVHLCEICFTDTTGVKFVHIPECGHYFCRDCLQSHCQAKIKDGQMTRVNCPDSECKVLIDGTTLKELVSPEMFELFDKTMLTFAIRSMSSTTWCPRTDCQQPADVDEDNQMGICTVCRLAFCLKCQKTYHGVNLCKDEEEAIELKKKQSKKILTQKEMDEEYFKPKEQKMLLSDNKDKGKKYQHDLFGNNFNIKERSQLARKYMQSKKSRGTLDSTYGAAFMKYIVIEEAMSAGKEGKIRGRPTSHLKRIKNLVEEAQGLVAHASIKPCPSCRTPIEKNGGCPAMYCIWCNTRFTWTDLSRY